MHPQKHALRQNLRIQLRNHAPLAEGKSVQIRQKIIQHPAWNRAKTVALFSPLRGEPVLTTLCPTPGKQLLYPRVVGSELEWIQVTDPHTQLLPPQLNRHRIAEPGGSQRVSIAEADLILVPGLGFSPCGRRLGRGGGYYDRALSGRGAESLAMGVCFEFQIVPEIPFEPHDQPLDGLFWA
ncbi:MAG: hypothetical protein RLZZ399_1768 [Verrucomicrobiota bacterium]|jgi:5-formyltetrahydrofolate cyclo-ligase